MNRPAAVVVGLCAHGLSISRSLAGIGVRVIAMEANRNLPGVVSNRVTVRFVDDINGQGLVSSLLMLAGEIGKESRPVLYLTNDRMVETVGMNVEVLARHYRLSWSSCADQLLPLLKKDRIEEQCRNSGLAYPRSVVVRSRADIDACVANLRFPLIAKPVQPISEFKTLVFEEAPEVYGKDDVLARCFPVLFQEYIPGSDDCIRFCALYLRNGEVLQHFEGRKLRSRPMGHTTVAISEPNDDIRRSCERFFRDLGLSGPVSLELKVDETGKAWVIEPTVGRTDFWVGLCIANGVDFPALEFESEVNVAPAPSKQRRDTIWINGERDPLGFFWVLTTAPEHIIGRFVAGVFVSWKDPAPLFRSLRELAIEVRSYIRRRFERMLR